jgi:tetratricopeptide (TPR) repeat protein
VVDIAKTGEMANVDPGLEAAYYGLGSIALAQNRPKDAIEPLTNAVAIVRTDADALYSLGTAYLLTDDADKAIDLLRRAIALVPAGWAEPYQRLSEAYDKQGNAAYATWAKAMAALTTGDLATAETSLKSITTGPAAVDALIGLAVLEETRGDSAAAASWYGQALDKDPQNVVAQLGLARVRAIAAPPSNHPALPSPTAGSN